MKNLWNNATKFVGTITILFSGLLVLVLIIDAIMKACNGKRFNEVKRRLYDDYDMDFDNDFVDEDIEFEYITTNKSKGSDKKSSK